MLHQSLGYTFLQQKPQHNNLSTLFVAMDPVSLAGLGLGAASIAFQIFGGLKEGLKTR